MSNWICLDASVIVRMLIGQDPDADLIWAQWDVWETTGKQFAAPTLLPYEITAVLYRYQRAGKLTAATIKDILTIAQAIPIKLVGDSELHRAALELATQYNLPTTYDAHYLALAQRLNAQFWTVDRRLVNTLSGVLPWVYTFN